MRPFRIFAALLLLACSSAQAGNRIYTYRINQTQGAIKVVVGDTFAGLPTTDPYTAAAFEPGAQAYAIDTALLYCWDGNSWEACGSGGSGAPDDAEYLVATLNAALSNERVCTDTATVDCDMGTAAQAKFNVIAGSLSSEYLYKPGVAGGQTAYGGTASTDDLFLFGNTAVGAPAILLSNTAGLNSIDMCAESTGSGCMVLAAAGSSFSFGASDFFTIYEDAGSTPVSRFGGDGSGSFEGIVGLGSDATSLATQTCIDVDTDRLYGDKDCDGTKDAGEEYLDLTGGGLSDGDYGDITVGGTGTTLTIDNDAVDEATLKAVDAAADEECLTYETTTGDFEWQACGSGGGAGRSSILNPPSASNANDDEFEDGNITGWTAFSSGTTNPITSGTIDYTASLTTPIYDATSISGSVAFQSDNSSVQVTGIRKSITLDTDATLSIGHTPAGRSDTTNRPEARVYLTNSGDSNETIAMFFERGTARICIEVNNNGATGTACRFLDADRGDGGMVFVIWKKSNVYHAAWASDDAKSWTYIGSVTKTGVTTLDRIELRTLTSATTPSAVVSYDFFRYEAALDYSLVNPAAGGGSGSITLDLGDDGGNDSVALAEFSSVNDDYLALNEPSADEAQIDFRKIPPYDNYDPMRPPSTCATCDEFYDNAASLTFSCNGGTITQSVAADSYRIVKAMSGGTTDLAACTTAAPAGSWTATALVSCFLPRDFSQGGLIAIRTGTQSTPTALSVCTNYQNSSGGIAFSANHSTYTSYTSAGTGIGNARQIGATAQMQVWHQMRYDAAADTIGCYISNDGIVWVPNGVNSGTNATIVNETGVTADPGYIGFYADDVSGGTSPDMSCDFRFLRVRTDANRNEASD